MPVAGGAIGCGQSSASASAVRAWPAAAACTIASGTDSRHGSSSSGSSGRWAPTAARIRASRPRRLRCDGRAPARSRDCTAAGSPAVHAWRSAVEPRTSDCSSGALAATSRATAAPWPPAAATISGDRHSASVERRADDSGDPAPPLPLFQRAAVEGVEQCGEHLRVTARRRRVEGAPGGRAARRRRRRRRARGAGGRRQGGGRRLRAVGGRGAGRAPHRAVRQSRAVE